MLCLHCTVDSDDVRHCRRCEIDGELTVHSFYEFEQVVPDWQRLIIMNRMKRSTIGELHFNNSLAFIKQQNCVEKM